MNEQFEALMKSKGKRFDAYIHNFNLTNVGLSDRILDLLSSDSESTIIVSPHSGTWGYDQIATSVAIFQKQPVEMHYLADPDDFEWPFLGSALKENNAHPYDKPSGSSSIVALLNEGKNVAAHVDTSYTLVGETGPTDTRYALYAQHSGATIIPVYVDGLDSAFGVTKESALLNGAAWTAETISRVPLIQRLLHLKGRLPHLKMAYGFPNDMHAANTIRTGEFDPKLKEKYDITVKFSPNTFTVGPNDDYQTIDQQVRACIQELKQ